jgi:hypothetical protein
MKTTNKWWLAIGTDDRGGMWVYRFATVDDAYMFVDAVNDSQGCRWHIQDEIGDAWTADEAIKHFTQ